MYRVTLDEDDDMLDEETEGDDSENPGFDLSRVLHQKGLTPLTREILCRMHGVPYVDTEKGENNDVNVVNEATTTDRETALTYSAETKRLTPCSADYADEYLKARGYESQGELRLRKHRGKWLRYDGTHYVSLSEEELRADVMNYFIETPLRGSVKRAFVSGILEHLAARVLIPPARSLPARHTEAGWKEEPETVTLQNGLIDLGSARDGTAPTLQPHSPRFVSRSVLPYDYDPSATCPTWMRFMEEVQPDEVCRRLVQQIFGYCLTFDMKYQKFFMFEGTGGNGKSVVTSILLRLVGTDNTSSLPLKCFHDKHGLISTYGKLVNFAGELKEKDPVAEDRLKQATGGDSMHFEAKYQQAFSAPFTAKIIICTNERPAFTDRNNGLWRRLIIIPFLISIPPEKQNPELEQKLALELAGIFNWAIQGAIDLNKTGRFVEPKVSLEALASFKEQANPEQVFFQECCRLSPDTSIGTQELYERYRQHAERTGHKPLNGSRFQAEVLKLTGVTKERPHTSGPRRHVYHGITVHGV